MKRLSTKQQDNSVIISIDGDIEFDDAFQLSNTLQSNFVDEIHNIILNLKNCQYIDSMGLGALARTLTITKKNKKNFMLCNLSPDCKEIIMMTMLNKHMNIYNNVEDCIASVNA